MLSTSTCARLLQFSCIAILCSAAYGQSTHSSCTPISQSSSAAPLGGTMTYEDLTKYNYPAQGCIRMASTPAGVSLNYTAAFATRFSTASFSEACVGVPYQLDGGPIHTLMSASGIIARTPSGGLGTFQGTSYVQADSLKLSFGGLDYSISTGVVPLKVIATLNADQSSDATICTPPGGIPATICVPLSLEEDPLQIKPCVVVPVNIPNSIWACIAQPMLGNGNMRVTYREGC